MTPSINALSEAWAKTPLCLNEWIVDPSIVPLDLRSLESLLASMPREWIIVRKGAASPGDSMPVVKDLQFNGDLEERLKHDNLHIMPRYVERISKPFQDLLGRFVELVKPTVNEIKDAMIGFFLSSPGAIAHFHADVGHNFLLHIHGTKKVHIFPGEDPRIFPSEAKERLFTGQNHALDYQPDFESRAFVYDFVPGMTVYTPSLFPHWVEVSREFSLSIGLSIKTGEEYRQRLVHEMNSRLRRLGIHPSPVGTKPVADGMKRIVETTFQQAKRVLRVG